MPVSAPGESLTLAVPRNVVDYARSAPQSPGTPKPAVGPLGWWLFIVLNATLFLRPAEIVSSLDNWPIYQCIILVCLVVCLPQILRRLTSQSLAKNPITVCVIGLLFAVVLSHLSHVNTYDARIEGLEFAKVVLYFLLLVTVVDTTARLRSFMIWIGVFTLALTILALLQYHGVIHIPALAEYYEIQANELDADTGQDTILIRLCGSGIFGNPNDMSRILAVGMAICIYCATDRRFRMFRWFWLMPFLLLGYALQLTYSRGGLLACLATLTTLFWARYGTRKTLLAGVVAVPLIAIAFAGRQMDLTTDTGTGQQRIQIWSEGFVLFMHSPVFGIGVNRYREEVGYVAHNSFVHCFTEMGFLGGVLFTGAWYLALRVPHWSRRGVMERLDPQLRALCPYVLAIVAGAIVGMLSSTRSYTLTTYLVLGLAACCISLAAPVVPAMRVNGRLAARLTAVGAAVLVMLYAYVRLSVHWT
jgi:putative inorganic carbon (hco3(-)) transporter